MNWRRFIRKCEASYHILKARAVPSFSQVGEDVIINYLFHQAGITNPTYLDIGTNLPVAGNNTYFFYNRGCKGICIEADPELYALIRKKRPNDVVLNIGIGLEDDVDQNLYIFPHPFTGWNTFSEEEAIKREKETGIKIKETRQIRMISIGNLIDKYFIQCPNFISIDIEGLDLEILKSMNFDKYRPDVICVETVSFGEKKPETHIHDIVPFLESKGYLVYANTHVNTIFVNSGIYQK